MLKAQERNRPVVLGSVTPCLSAALAKSLAWRLFARSRSLARFKACLVRVIGYRSPSRDIFFLPAPDSFAVSQVICRLVFLPGSADFPGSATPRASNIVIVDTIRMQAVEAVLVTRHIIYPLT
jgi:hypothetical protein